MGGRRARFMFRALKQLNRPVEYIRYPGAGHELTRSGEPRQRMDHMLRIIEFFKRYALNNGPAQPSPTQLWQRQYCHFERLLIASQGPRTRLFMRV